MNAVLVLTLVCALAYVTSGQPEDCNLVDCADCAVNEKTVYVGGQCCPKCIPLRKVRVCPEPTGGICLQECSSNSECRGNMLCCYNGCGNVCTAPILKDADCAYNNKVYSIGESFPDDCNTCTCFEDGVACTEIACAP